MVRKEKRKHRSKSSLKPPDPYTYNHYLKDIYKAAKECSWNCLKKHYTHINPAQIPRYKEKRTISMDDWRWDCLTCHRHITADEVYSHVSDDHLVMRIDDSTHSGFRYAWEKDQKAKIIIHTDAGHKINHQGDKIGSGAVVIRKGCGKYVTALGIFYDTRLTSTDHVEAETVLLALQYVQEVWHVKESKIRTDSQNTAKLINSEVPIDKLNVSNEIKAIIKECREILAELRSNGFTITVEWVPREINMVADAVAGAALTTRQTIIYEKQPEIIDRLLFEDCNGIKTSRGYKQH